MALEPVKLQGAMSLDESRLAWSPEVGERVSLTVDEKKGRRVERERVRSSGSSPNTANTTQSPLSYYALCQ
jgi:hypothetical protein